MVDTYDAQYGDIVIMDAIKNRGCTLGKKNNYELTEQIKKYGQYTSRAHALSTSLSIYALTYARIYR